MPAYFTKLISSKDTNNINMDKHLLVIIVKYTKAVFVAVFQNTFYTSKNLFILIYLNYLEQVRVRLQVVVMERHVSTVKFTSVSLLTLSGISCIC